MHHTESENYPDDKKVSSRKSCLPAQLNLNKANERGATAEQKQDHYQPSNIMFKNPNVEPRNRKTDNAANCSLDKTQQCCSGIQIEQSCEKASMEAEADLRNDLMRLMIGDEHLLKIKAQYLDERTALNLRRPVNFAELKHYFQNKYSRLLNLYYTTPTRELMIQIHNQQDLDQVIQLHDGTNSNSRRMRLILSQKREQLDQQNYSSQTAQPPLGIHHNPANIAESPLSDSSSMWSLVSGRSAPLFSPNHNSRMECWTEDELQSHETPRAPANWREGRCLGQGAFGQVFVCLNVDNGEQLVVKKVRLSSINTVHRQRVLATLENELNALGSLNHPHIVRYLGIVKRQDCVNIFMELMAGGSLKDQINEYGAISEAVTIHFTSQILDGLNYLHAREIIHRDIKPANILRHTQAHVKIADFGAAKFLQAICTDQGIDIEGTPHYMAPEIVRGEGDRRFEASSDIWSVGITVFEMLTTQTPWSGIDSAMVHLRIAFDRPDLGSLSNVSTDLRTAIEQMLLSDSKMRPQADELLRRCPFVREKELHNNHELPNIS